MLLKTFNVCRLKKRKLKLKFSTTHLKNATLFCNNSTFYDHSCPLHIFDRHGVCRSLWSTFRKTAFPSLRITFAAEISQTIKRKQRFYVDSFLLLCCSMFHGSVHAIWFHEMSAIFLHPLIFPSSPWWWRQCVKRWKPVPSFFFLICMIYFLWR